MKQIWLQLERRIENRGDVIYSRRWATAGVPKAFGPEQVAGAINRFPKVDDDWTAVGYSMLRSPPRETV